MIDIEHVYISRKFAIYAKNIRIVVKLLHINDKIRDDVAATTENKKWDDLFHNKLLSIK